MFDAVKTWVSNIIAVILFVSIIEIILSDGKMKKYVNLVAGVLVVLIIVSPLVRAFNKDFKLEMPEMNFKEPIPIEDLKMQGAKIEKLRSKQIIQAYKIKMEESIRNQVNEIDGVYCDKVICKVKENINDNSLGDIEEIALYLRKSSRKVENSEIKPVEVKIGEDKKESTPKSVEIPDETKNEIIKNISYTCRISPEHIKIIDPVN